MNLQPKFHVLVGVLCVRTVQFSRNLFLKNFRSSLSGKIFPNGRSVSLLYLCVCVCVMFEREAREFQYFFSFHVSICHSNDKNISRIAHSYNKKFTRKSTLEHGYINTIRTGSHVTLRPFQQFKSRRRYTVNIGVSFVQDTSRPSTHRQNGLMSYFNATP